MRIVNGTTISKTNGLSELLGQGETGQNIAFVFGAGPNRVVVQSAQVREVTGKGKIVKVEP